MSVWCRTDTGRKRESNQDSFLINQELGLYIVADGMGGHSGGEVASAMAVKAVEQFVLEHRAENLEPRDLISKAYRQASNAIYDRAARDTKLMGMGTTMVLIYVRDGSAFIANVGDSRVYLFQRPHLWQITEDHSLMNEQLRAGIITEEQVRTFANRNVITRSVGYERDVNVDIFERPTVLGDEFLLCSDGLTGMVDDSLISQLFTENPGEQVTNACIEKALQNGGEDNVTVMHLQVQT